MAASRGVNACWAWTVGTLTGWTAILPSCSGTIICATMIDGPWKPLLAYNIEDVVNLETLMVKAYNLKLGQTPFAKTHAIGLPQRPDLPFSADAATVERIRGRWY